MSSDTSSSPSDAARQRLLEAATELFARNGYHGTSVREICARADANVAMVNYYFGSKRGLLEELFDLYFDRHQALVEEVVAMEGPFEDRVRHAMRGFTGLFRANPDLARIAFTELAYDEPEALAHKVQRMQQLIGKVMQGMQPHAERAAGRPLDVMVLGPAVLGGLLSHFLVLKPLLESPMGLSFDDDFYQRFPEELASLLVFGIRGRPKEAP